MTSPETSVFPTAPPRTHYERVKLLGRGGMAEVSLSLLRSASFTKLVVRKTLDSRFAHDPVYIAMLRQEGHLAARLNHPNVVQTLDVGVEAGVPYLAMEFLEGVPYVELSRLKGEDALPLPFHLRILGDMLAGLHHAHELRDFDGTPFDIVHCDVSPPNLVVTCSGISKVVDFGVARSSLDRPREGERVVRGKFHYMAPEQLVGGAVDRRADVFCVGLMLWEAITGERRFKISNKDPAQQLLHDDSPDVRTLNPDCPNELAEICARALSRDPAMRFQTALEMAKALDVELARLGDGSDATLRSQLGGIVEERFETRRAAIAKRLRTVASAIEVPKSDSTPALTLDSLSPASITKTVAPPAHATARAEPRQAPRALLLLAGAFALALATFVPRPHSVDAFPEAAHVSASLGGAVHVAAPATPLAAPSAARDAGADATTASPHAADR